MVFGPDDENEFYDARDALVAQFEAWLPGAGPQKPQEMNAAAGTAGIALDWKYGYSDGDLGLWTLPHFDEFLLQWFPRKVAIPSVLAAQTPRELNLFMLFLASQGLLSGGSSSVRSIEKYLRQIVAPFTRAFDDPARHGLAKSLFGGLADLGIEIDPGNPASLAKAMEQFNSLSFEARGEIVGLTGQPPGGRIGARPVDPWEDLLDGVELPPAPTLSKSRADELAKQTSVISNFRLISEFCDRPRKLTKTGKLTVADAIGLATLLGIDEAAINRTPKIRSAADLGALHFFLEWALKSGTVRRIKGTLTSTSSWNKKSAFEQLESALTTLVEAGPLTLGDQSRWRFDNIDVILDGGVTAFLAIVYMQEELAIPFVEVLDAALDVVLAYGTWSPHTTHDMKVRRIAAKFQKFWEVINLTGIVELSDVVEPADPLVPRGPGDREDEVDSEPVFCLALTELGRGCVARHLESQGFTIPVVGQFADKPLDEVLAHVTRWPRSRVEAEFVAWAAKNGADTTIAELQHIVGSTDDPQPRIASVDLAGLLGPDAERAVRSLIETRARAHALSWLEIHNHEVPEAGDDERAQLALLAALEMMSLHCAGDPEDDEVMAGLFVKVFERVPVEEVFRFLWHIEEPWAGDLLAAVGRLHPDKAIAKQARKAVMQHRTHLANKRNNS